MMSFEELLHRVEATSVDYKADLETEKPKSWLKSVSAFANTAGGHILFGITDDTHEVIGLDEPQIAVSKISELIASRISPAPHYEIKEICGSDNGHLCLDLFVQAGPYYPYYYHHERTKEAYVRHGDRSELASDAELNNLILKGRHITYDALPSPYRLSDASFTLFAATYKMETGEEVIVPKELESFGLLTEDGQLTNAGLLLCDQGLLKQSKVVCTRWKGVEKGSVEGDALDDQEYRNASLLSLLTNAESFIRNNSKHPWTIRGMRREEKSDYPFRAVREVLVNAIIHRDYQLLGTEIHVDMFDDRMEIVSPGGMMNGSRIQDLDLRHIPSIRRNEVISDLFDRMGLMDRRGSGIGRILNSYAEYVEQPAFYSNEYYFSVILPNRSMANAAQLNLASKLPEDGTEKTQPATEKTQLADQKLNSDQEETDWELKYFETMLRKQTDAAFRSRTVRNLLMLFQRYRYRYTFNRRNIAEQFGISENAASQILRKCLDQQIIQKVKLDEYRFLSK